jgi:hypothetical protein
MFKGKTYVYLMNDLNGARSLDMCDEHPIECSQHKNRVLNVLMIQAQDT